MPDAPQFEIGSCIPVLRMFDETEAKAFYMGYLGLQIDWEHRFEDSSSSPLWMQIRLGHATRETPVAEVRIPVKGIDAYILFSQSQADGLSQA